MLQYRGRRDEWNSYFTPCYSPAVHRTTAGHSFFWRVARNAKTAYTTNGAAGAAPCSAWYLLLFFWRVWAVGRSPLGWEQLRGLLLCPPAGNGWRGLCVYKTRSTINASFCSTLNKPGGQSSELPRGWLILRTSYRCNQGCCDSIYHKWICKQFRLLRIFLVIQWI